MKILFIHQNFPGQYLHLAQYLLAEGKHEIVALGEEGNIRRRGAIQGITTLAYPAPAPAGENTHHYLQTTEAAVRRGQSVARSLLQLKQRGYVPDVISVHPGWGEGIFVRDVYPKVPVVMFCEYFFRAGQADLLFDAEFPHSSDWQFSVRVRNAAQLISLPGADALVCPTEWQASRYPKMLRHGIRIIHDGIDTGFMHPDKDAGLTIQPLSVPGESRVVSPIPKRAPSEAENPSEETAGPPITLRKSDKVVTFMARNLEPYRGYHIFMRSLAKVQAAHPDAHILIVGADGTSYSPALPDGENYKRKYFEEVKDGLDLSKVHFLGRIPYIALRALFRISSVHIYLTYPFVLSWSVLEAMSCETPVLASDTAPVREVLEHGVNGLLTDFFDTNALASKINDVLASPEKYAALGGNARKTVLERFELRRCLEAQAALLLQTAKAGVTD